MRERHVPHAAPDPTDDRPVEVVAPDDTHSAVFQGELAADLARIGDRVGGHPHENVLLAELTRFAADPRETIKARVERLVKDGLTEKVASVLARCAVS